MLAHGLCLRQNSRIVQKIKKMIVRSDRIKQRMRIQLKLIITVETFQIAPTGWFYFTAANFCGTLRTECWQKLIRLAFGMNVGNQNECADSTGIGDECWKAERVCSERRMKLHHSLEREQEVQFNGIDFHDLDEPV